MFSLLYVSRALLREESARSELDAIIRVSVARNQAASVTGALLYTGERFAQILEGPEKEVRLVVASIERDSRHTDFTIVEQGAIERRRFARWAMADLGLSTFAASIVARALSEGSREGGRATRNLTRLLQELAQSATQSSAE